MRKAPIALFVYNRPWHAESTVQALQKNEIASESDLFIFSDAPRKPQVAGAVEEVRKYIKTIDGFNSITIIERDENLGLANSIIDGVTRLSNEHGRVIVLEDDMVTSTYFLTYMNEALEKYANDDRVISIHGWLFPTENILPETFFLLGADCWGWATWKRGWELFNSNGQYLLDQLNRRKLINDFDYNGAYPYKKMLKNQIKGRIDSWAVRWYASAFLAGKLTLYPGRSLVHNIGNDNSGTNCRVSDQYDTELSLSPIRVGGVEVDISQVGRKAFECFFRKERVGVVHRWMTRAFALIGIGK